MTELLARVAMDFLSMGLIALAIRDHIRDSKSILDDAKEPNL